MYYTYSSLLKVSCSVVHYYSPLSKKAKLSKWQKSRENRTNMDIILLFLAKPLDTTLVYITYPPLGGMTDVANIVNSNCCVEDRYCFSGMGETVNMSKSLDLNQLKWSSKPGMMITLLWVWNNFIRNCYVSVNSSC